MNEKVKVVSETITPEKVSEVITPDLHQPRIKKEDIEELAQNIGEVGQQEAIHVDANNIIIDGERRWMAVQGIGYPLDVRRHTDVETLDQRDELRDILEGQKREHHAVDRAYNWARRVVDINLVAVGEEKRTYTSTQLRDMRDKEYDRLKDLLGDRTMLEAYHIPHGYSKLADQLTKRTGKHYSNTTVREYCRMVVLPDQLLGQITLYITDRLNHVKASERKGLEVSYGLYTARLYRYPETMHKLINEIFDPDIGFESVKEFKVRVQEYQKGIEDDIKRKADEKRVADHKQKLDKRKADEKRVADHKQKLEDEKKAQAKAAEDAEKARGKKEEEDKRKKDRGAATPSSDDTDTISTKEAEKPTKAEELLLDDVSNKKSLEQQIRLAEKDELLPELIEEWRAAAVRLKDLLFIDNDKIVTECTKYIAIIKKMRDNVSAEKEIVEKISEALGLGLNVVNYNQRLEELIEDGTVKENEKQFIADIESEIMAPRSAQEAEKEIAKAETEGVDEGKIKEFRAKLKPLVESKEIGRDEVLREFIDEVLREVALKRMGPDAISGAQIDNPEETEKKLLWNATDGLEDDQRMLLQVKATYNGWAPSSVKKLVPTLLSFEESIRIMILGGEFDIGYRVIEKIAKIPTEARQVAVIEYLKEFSIDGKKAEAVVQDIIDGRSLETDRQQRERPPLGWAEKILNRADSTMYWLLSISPKMARRMGQENWDRMMKYVHFYGVYSGYLYAMNPQVSDDMQPEPPSPEGIGIDEDKIKAIEVEYEIVPEGGAKR